MDSKTVSVGGQQISYAESAGAGRPVVFVHGNSASSGTWQGVLDGSFGQRFRCLAIDLPGHGDSAPAADQAIYSLPGYAGVLAGFAAELGVSDAVFVGWSLGGHIALEAAPSLPQAAGFVIFGSPAGGGTGRHGQRVPA
ncbi:MAG TPA: alpha/beta fold hydrolase [Streptosporangiaceae bacterium]